MMKIWDSYINGNCKVLINIFNGSKIRIESSNEQLSLDFPESLDIKITNKCNRGCPFCHENSNPKGINFSPANLSEKLLKLPNYPIELAIGGGNVLECKKELEEFLDIMKQENRKFLYRFTLHYNDYIDGGRDYIKYLSDKYRYKFEVGVSISNSPSVDYDLLLRDRVIFHIIVGIFPLSDLNFLINQEDENPRILVLGYKDFGRGLDNFPKPEVLSEWKEKIKTLIFEQRLKIYKSNFILGFDNLAIEQLDLRSSLLKDEFDSMYFGDEFTHSMYIDAVAGFYSPTSSTDYKDRIKWNSCSIIEFFQKYKNDYNCIPNRI